MKSKIIHTAVVLHAGWEMDNEAWVVEKNGVRRAEFTNHGGHCAWSRKQIEAKLAETEASAESLRKMLSLLPGA